MDSATAEASVARRLKSDDALLVVQVWLATRLMFAIVAVTIAVTERRSLDSVVAQWDVAHFLTIGTQGYADPNNMAFFPGWPLVLRVFTEFGLSPVLMGSVVALVCSLLAAFALRRLAGAWAAVAWLLAPTAVFTAVPYTEAAFCAAAFWAWERAEQRRWGQAALLAALACTLRVSGLFLIGALVLLALTQPLRGRGSRGSGRPAGRSRAGGRGVALAWLLLPVAVLGGYVLYLYGLTGSWTAWFSAQADGWHRGFHWPWEALRNHWDVLWRPTPEHPEWVWMYRGEIVAWSAGVVVTFVCLARKRIAEAGWVGVQVLAFSLSYWLMSVNRAVLLWFPLWKLIGEFIDARAKHPTRGWLIVAWVVGLLAWALQIAWARLYFTGGWAS